MDFLTEMYLPATDTELKGLQSINFCMFFHWLSSIHIWCVNKVYGLYAHCLVLIWHTSADHWTGNIPIDSYDRSTICRNENRLEFDAVASLPSSSQGRYSPLISLINQMKRCGDDDTTFWVEGSDTGHKPETNAIQFESVQIHGFQRDNNSWHEFHVVPCPCDSCIRQELFLISLWYLTLTLDWSIRIDYDYLKALGITGWLLFILFFISRIFNVADDKYDGQSTSVVCLLAPFT